MLEYLRSLIELLQHPPGHLLIGFTGDIMIGRLVNNQLRISPAEYPWGNCLPLLQATMLNIGNLETTFTTSDEKVLKTFNFKSDPSHVQSLIAGNFHYVTVANNHILDYSLSGFEETLSTLKKAGIGYVGAGANHTEASAPLLFKRGEITCGMLGLTDNEPTWKALAEKPGVRYIEIGDLSALASEIKQLRNAVHVLIISMHWGPNMVERPPHTFVDFAHRLIDLGVDIIHGHSAHIFQGVELYHGGLIMYDTGDFVDDYYVDPTLLNDRSFFFCVEISKNGFEKLIMIPTKIGSFQVNIATEVDRIETLRRMSQLCAEFHTPTEQKEDCLIIKKVR